jgi:hypothetical protein
MRNFMAIVLSGVLAATAAFAAADKKAMKEQEEMGKKDVYPEGKLETKK